MTIGELFITLGFKADTMKLTDFMRAVGELNMASIAGALGLGTLYEATSKIMNIADSTAMSIFGFTQVTGMSGKQMQQFSSVAEQLGASAQDAQGSLKSLQMAMLQVQLGRGNMEPFILAGIDPTKERNVFAVMDKIQRFLKDPTIADGVKRMVTAEFGLSESMIQVLKSSDSLTKSMQDQVYVGMDQVNRIREYHKELFSMTQEWKKGLVSMGADLAPILEGWFKIGTFIEHALNSAKGFVPLFTALAILGLAIGGIIAPWIAILTGIAVVVGLIANYWGSINSWINNITSKIENFTKPVMDFLSKGANFAWGWTDKMLPPNLALAGAGSTQNISHDIDVHVSGVSDPEKASDLVVKKLQRMLTDRYYHQKLQER